MPLELTQANQSAAVSAPARRRTRVTDSDRLFFTEQLALMLENGMNLHAALTGLAKQAEKPALRELIEALAGEVEGGKSFSHALSQHPEVFEVTWVSLVAASESGGFMHEVLVQLAQMEERRTALRNHLTSALSYPGFLVFFSAAVVIFVLIVVFPKFGDMFVSIRDQLPVTTLVLMWCSDILVNYWMYLLAVAAVVAWAARTWIVSPPGRQAIDTLKLKLPGIRTIMIELYLVQLFRVLGLSLQNGVSVPDALASSRDVVANTRFRNFICQVEAQVQGGGGIAACFERAEFIPPLVRQMVTTGEDTGNLAAVLTRVAEFYERELGKRLDRVSSLAEPVMLLVMGLVVGVLVSSLILPIFKLSRAVT